ERNCISNIHPPEGLDYPTAATIATGLIDGARRLGRSGIELKDTSSEHTLVRKRRRKKVRTVPIPGDGEP
ncbi:ethanolamine ammonia-lyase light chain EutC, partial [Nocardia gipuzkoensis]